MKAKLLLSLLLFTLSIQIKAIPSLAPEEAQHFKEQAHDMLIDYYSGLYLLVTKLSQEDKDVITLKAINDNFRSEHTPVFNDYQKDAHIKQMPIKEYLGQLNVLYNDDKLGITFTDPIVTVEGVYVEGDSFFVKTVVQWSLISSTKPELNNTATVDSLLVPAKIQNKEYILTNIKASPTNNASQDINPSFLTFKVTPSNAVVKIDGQPIYYCPGMKNLTVPGNKRIEVTAPGYQPYILNFNAKEGNNNITVELIANMGALNIEASNKKATTAQILIDGKFVGYIPQSRIALTEGFHSIQFIKTGYFSKRRNVNIKAQKDESIKVDLINIEHVKTAGKVALGVASYFLRGAN